jgi:hypothetical protein
MYNGIPATSGENMYNNTIIEDVDKCAAPLHNLVICFAAGTGGHFIASICYTLLYNQTIPLSDDGSMHEIIPAIGDKYLSGIILDTTLSSYIQELHAIENMPEFDITTGHFRNLVALQKLGKRIIYIEFTADDRTEIKRRLHQKKTNAQLEKITYDLLAGESWPSWDEYQSGAVVPELEPNIIGLSGKDDLLDWYYITPVNQKNLCKITFTEILTGYELVDKLVTFLDVSEFDRPQIYDMIDSYRSSQ